MAFDLKYLSRVEQTSFLDKTLNVGAGMDTQSTPQLWTYNAFTSGADDTLAEVVAADYFLGGYGYISTGDFIFVRTSNPSYALLAVTASSSSTVTTSDITS